MDQSLIKLKELINSIQPIGDKEWDEFSLIWKPFDAKRKEILTQEGEVEKYLYFVLSGVQRVCYLDAEGREASLVFTYAPSFGGVLDSMLLEAKSKYNFQALSNSEFLRAEYSDVRKLMSEHAGINSLIFKGSLYAFSGLLERMAELQCYSSEEKFKKMLRRSPHILQHVPHKYLANYLGIDPTNFSKLINRIVI
jgi:CRP-like cAMP-binding protein